MANQAGKAIATSKLQLFDLVAGGAFERALEGMGRQESGQEGVWSYLPVFLQMLRDGSARSGEEAGDRFDKLLRVVVLNRRADSTEDYLNVARDCCIHLRKGTTAPSSIASKTSKTLAKLSSSLPPPSSSLSSSKPDSRSGSPAPGAGPGGAGGGGNGDRGGKEDGRGKGSGDDNRPEKALTEWDLVIATMDGEGSDDEGGGRERSGGGGAGVAMPRRDGKQMDLLLEVESLEPQQLMSVVLRELLLLMAAVRRGKGDVIPSTPDASTSDGASTVSSAAVNNRLQTDGGTSTGPVSAVGQGAKGVTSGVGGGIEALGQGRNNGGRGGGGKGGINGKGGGRGAGTGGDSGGSSESLDLLSQRSLEDELHVLLPVLLAHAPRIRMREASAALLRTRFAPSLLRVSAMNDPLSLESIVLGVCDAVTPMGNLSRISHRVTQRAEELVMRLCELGTMASVKVRGVLVSRRSLPGVCARMACEVIRDADRFLLSIAAATAAPGDEDASIAVIAAAAAASAAAAARNQKRKHLREGSHRRGRDGRVVGEDDGSVAGTRDAHDLHWFWGYLRHSLNLTGQLLDAVLEKVTTLAEQLSAGGVAAASSDSGSDTNTGTTGGGILAGQKRKRSESAVAIGELCTALRSYCELVTLARPVLSPQHLHAATSVPLAALEALLSPGDCPPMNASSSSAPIIPVAGTRATDATDHAEAPPIRRLSEIILCAVVVTASRVGAEDFDTSTTASGSGDGGGSGASAIDANRAGGKLKIGQPEDDDDTATNTASAAAVVVGVDMEEGLRVCASGLRRLVALGRSKSDGSSSRGVGVCCVGLYAALLLRGSRFNALSDAVGGLLGTNSPLSGPDGIDALQALRNAAIASSEAEAPLDATDAPGTSSPPAPVSSQSPSLRPASALSSPAVTARGGSSSSQRGVAGSTGSGGTMPPLSLGQPGASSNGGGGGAGTGTRTSRSKSRSWSVGSGDVGGVATGPLSSNAAATAAIAELGIVAGGAGWFSEGALAELVRTLPAPGGDDSRGSRGDAKIADAVADCEEKSLDAMEECEEVPKTGSTADGGHGPAAADAWCGAGRWPLGAIDCVEEALEQGMLVRHRVDVREWVLSTIKASSSPSQAAERMGDSSAQHTSLHPSLLRVVCLYAAACVAPVAMGPSLGSSARPQPFVMAPIVPTEITEIVHAIDWGMIEIPSQDPLFPGMPPPLPQPCLASTSPLQPGLVVGAGGGMWKMHMKARTASRIGAMPTADAMPALLATCFALYHTHCISQRNSPFPGSLRYELRELPLTRMLRLTAAAVWRGGSRGGGNCLDEGLASLHAFLVPAVMDVCPELFCPEHRTNNVAGGKALPLLGDAAHDDTAGGTGVAVIDRGHPARETRDILEPEFVRRAAGALCTTPLTAADVLRALLSSPASTLVGVGQEALKTMLPKMAGPNFSRRSTVVSLCSAVWMRLYGLHPNGQVMEAWTLNALLQRDSDSALPRVVTYDTMCREPVLVFRCRAEALSCPYLLGILLRVLRSLLLASERTIDQAVVAKERRWEMVSASARRKNQKAAAEAAFAAATAAVTAAAAAAAAAGGSGAAPPPQPWEDVEENAFKVDGVTMLLVQQAIVARCLLVVALGGAGIPDNTDAVASRTQCGKLVCDFLQAMVSECPPLLHLLLRQTLPMEAFALLLDGVPACRSATQYLGDVMGQQSWEARAFGVRAAALLAERFPTEEACHLCKAALHVLSSMCDSEARAPRGLNAVLSAGVGNGNVSAPPAALLACGMPPSDLVRETFSYAVNICQAFPSLTSDAVNLIESILQKQDLSKMHGAKGGSKLRKRLTKVLASIKSTYTGSSRNVSTSVVVGGADATQFVRVGLGGGGVVGDVGEAEAAGWPMGNPVAKRPRLV